MFALNGFEDLEKFVTIGDSELNYFGIVNQTHRRKIKEAIKSFQEDLGSRKLLV